MAANKFNFLKELDDENGWKTIPKKHSGKGRNAHTSNPVEKKSPSYTKIFEANDKHILYQQKNVLKISQIVGTGVNAEEYNEAYAFVGKKTDETGWGQEVEAFNIVQDKRLISSDMTPIFSNSLCGSIAINTEEQSRIHVDPSTIFLPTKMAVFMQHEPVKNVKEHQMLAVLQTVKDLWCYINLCSGFSTGDDYFTAAIGSNEVAEAIFKSIFAAGTSFNKDIADINFKDQKTVSKIVSKYNKMHPTWCFVKIPDDVTKETFKPRVPSIKVEEYDSRKKSTKEVTVNCIDINLKEIDANMSKGIYAFGKHFAKGYIPRLILSFVGGQLPDEVCAITFSKTIAVMGRYYFKGYRVRVYVSKTSNIMHCKNFLEKDFIKQINKEENVDYRDCVVRISVPKKAI